MAASLNKVFLIGNLTRDPELRYTTQGTPVLTLRLAVNRRYRTQTGDIKEETGYFNVVVWGKIAENCNKYLSKGRPIFVEGRLSSRTYELQDGQKRNVVEIVAENIQFLGSQIDKSDAYDASDTPPEYSDGEPFESSTNGDSNLSPSNGDDVPF